MTRFLHCAAFLLGLAAVCWVGIGYVGSNPLALLVTMLIGAFYLVGGFELRRFDRATATLARTAANLAETPATLGPWLDRLHPSLRNAVRLRVEGERVGLPGPALTPYLAGLLVLLGMLGTFLGMVVTLNGTGLALDSASDVPAIRASLSAPIKGLGLAFGTSIAGVAASAMLGLVSALCRRDRLLAAQSLDTRIATTLRVFSLAHQREESFKLLQLQAAAMPEVVGRLQDMMAAMERQSHALNEQLVAGQDHFHGKAEDAYVRLASSVDRSLKESLTEGARIAAATIQPVVEATMAGIAREAAMLHDTVAQAAHARFDQLSTRFESTTAMVADLWKDALAEHRRTSEALSADLRQSLDRVGKTFDDHSSSLLRSVGQAHVDLQAEITSRDQQRLAGWTQSLDAMAASLQREWQQSGEHAARRNEQICQTLGETARDISAQSETHAKNTIAEIARLAQAAGEAPRAAAEVIAELRSQHAEGMVRDNATLEERSRILETLGNVLEAVNHASTDQRAAIDALIAGSADLLDRVGDRFAERIDAHTEKMSAVAAQVTSSAVEVASLGETFGFAVQLFCQSNEKFGAHLERIEAALGKSTARSDEQLAYYVAQAREVIDLSIMSQKEIVEDLQQLAQRRTAEVSEAG